MAKIKYTGYELSRNWFNFCFENPEKIKPIHTALYFFAIEHCNRLGWKEKFGLPTEMTKEAIGVKSWHTYINAFNDLVNWGFFFLVEKSKNQYSSNIIALSKNDKAHNKALDEAMTKHGSKQVRSTDQSNDSIIKPITINQKQGNKKKPQKRFTPPTLDEVKAYFKENGYTEQSAEKAFYYYEEGGWKDSHNNKVKNWKQKMRGVWFKDENKITSNGTQNSKLPLI